MFLLAIAALLTLHSASSAPCPGKWMPPFRASPRIYSEFPEDWISRSDTGSVIQGRSIDGSYHASTSYDYASGEGKKYTPETSSEYSGESTSEEYYIPPPDVNQYNGYTDYRDPGEFSLESFELDPAVDPEVNMVEPPTETADVQEEEVPSTRPPPPVRETEEPPTQGTRTPKTVQVKKVQVSGKSNGDWWKAAMATREVQSLQVMKPPPLGQTQTWTVKRQPRKVMQSLKRVRPANQQLVYYWS